MRLKGQGMTQVKISALVGVSRGAVRRTLDRHKQKGTVKTLKRTGRPKKLGKVTRRWLKRYVKKSRKATLSEILMELHSMLNINIHLNTLRYSLHALGFRACVAARKPWLSPINRLKRFNFAKTHSRRTHAHWSHVIWSDESTFQLFGSSSRQLVWRQPGERFISASLVPTVKHGGGKIMVWGMMTADGPGPIHRVVGSMNSAQYFQVLEDKMLPAARAKYGSNFIFQQDNAPCHVSKVMRAWFDDDSVSTLNWPPQSPDLSPIENLWKEIGIGLKKYKLSNLEDLW